MKCTNKRKILLWGLLAVLLLSGCGNTSVSLYSSNYVYEVDNKVNDESFAADSFVGSNVCAAIPDLGTDQTNSSVASAAGVFNCNTNKTLYSQNLLGQVHPASTTKILTAYIILRDCELNEEVTVSESVTNLDKDSSLCYIEPGDKLTVQDLLYGLLLNSGNDAAIALAEHHSHSIDSFAEEMNKTAKNLGATKSKFMNPHGLDDENHYVTLYDMYLIFNEAIKNEVFVKIISTLNYDAEFISGAGIAKNATWSNTNRYLTGKAKSPNGITVIGGKTGTTFQSGYCLVLLSENEKKERIISIVYKADSSWNLYLLMNQILVFAN